ncbi:hypothetical protein ACQPZP_42060 [Spirillospora sp. CA-142024]|uniref:hypothetical protein n=1 Tax=Spirillospora sp. CA-142024 TaxID=3240036 RepID=UPI003D8B422B
MNTEPRAAPPVPAPWTGKPVRRLTAAELAEALEYLERHRPEDDVLGRALAGEFARRTAATEFATRTTVTPPAAPGFGGSRRPGT